jgi:hypothetical protein
MLPRVAIKKAFDRGSRIDAVVERLDTPVGPTSPKKFESSTELRTGTH